MKIHITNLYNFNNGDELVKAQHKFAEAGRELGFRELGIFQYRVDTDTASELSKRLDGVIAALESEDVVFFQLPTGNGISYEQLLIQKIKAYRGTKVVLLLHAGFAEWENDRVQSIYKQIFDLADEKCCLEKMSPVYAQTILMNTLEQVVSNREETSAGYVPINDEVQIGFGLHDKTGDYSAWVGTVMQSIIETTSSNICFHILHDETLNNDNKSKLIETATRRGHRIRFHFISMNLFHDVMKMVGRFTVGTMFRVMLPELLPELSRIIYLDADLLVNRDIKELWDMDISDYYLAAVPDAGTFKRTAFPLPVMQKEVEQKRYINAGVLYLNLDKIRECGNMKEQVINYLIHNRESMWPDQDALNCLYKEKIMLLDFSWNYFVLDMQRNKEQGIEKRIYHYAGTKLILYISMVDRLYYEILSRTPWGEEVGRRQLIRAFDRTDDLVIQRTNLINRICQLQSESGIGVRYVYYGDDTELMKNLYSLVPPKPGDYKVSANPEKYEQTNKPGVMECRPLSELKNETLPYIVFVLHEADDGTALSRLDEMGLENGKDYFVIARLLTVDKGGFL